MAHTALYGGTVYEKKGGADLVGGTVYKKDHGKVLVGGTAYEVGFAPTEVTVAIYATGTYVGMGCYLTIDGVKYGTALSTDSYVFPVGTVIACYAKTDSEDLSDSNPDYGYHSKYGNIRVNGEYVAWATEDDHDATYDYIVTENAYIELVNSKGLGRVRITEIPEGHALVQITGSGSYSTVKPGVSYVTIDGVNYSTVTTVVVPIGTVVACTVGTMSNELSEGCVKVNGNTVLTAESGNRLTYDYTVNGNVTINLKTNRDADKDMNGYIEITEQ